MLVTKLLAVITLFTVMVPRCAADPNVSAAISFKAALTVAVWVPLAIDRFVPAPVSVFKVLAPSVPIALIAVTLLLVKVFAKPAFTAPTRHRNLLQLLVTQSTEVTDMVGVVVTVGEGATGPPVPGPSDLSALGLPRRLRR